MGCGGVLRRDDVAVRARGDAVDDASARAAALDVGWWFAAAMVGRSAFIGWRVGGIVWRGQVFRTAMLAPHQRVRLSGRLPHQDVGVAIVASPRLDPCARSRHAPQPMRGSAMASATNRRRIG